MISRFKRAFWLLSSFMSICELLAPFVNFHRMRNKIKMIWKKRPQRIAGLITTKVCLSEKELRRTRRAVFEPISRMFCRDKEPLSPARYFCSRCRVCVCSAPAARGGFGIQIWSIPSLLSASAVSERLTVEASRAVHWRKSSFQGGMMSWATWVGPFLTCWQFMRHSGNTLFLTN